ncbi:MAG: Flagellar biosynthesis protein FliS [Holophagaceae bacterium]|nr:Flagellar biosynthesis protein FliS [Holophagaceae bacterium]
MHEHSGKKAADQYLIQRIQGASPEQVAAMLLEGGQRFLSLAIQAMKARNLIEQANYVGRVADIIFGLKERLNHEQGGEVVENLIRIYDWWTEELYEGALNDQPQRLQLIFAQMGEFKTTWEQLHRRKTGGDQAPKASGSLDGLSV